MKVRFFIPIASLSALCLVICSPKDLRAQAAAEAGQAAAPAGKIGKPTLPKGAPTQPVPAPEPILQPVASPNQDITNDLTVTVGKAVVLDLARPVTRIVVGVGNFAQATAVSPTQVLVNGMAPGETTLILWDVSGGRQFFNVTVRPSSYAQHDQIEAVRRQLRLELPGQDVTVMTEGGNVYLRGTVSDLTSSARAVTIASTAGKVINLLNVKVPAAEPQILVKIRFASVDRTKQRQYGFDIFSTGFGNTIGEIQTGEFGNASIQPSAGTAASLTSSGQLFAFYPGINLGAILTNLESRGLAETLAEPNLLTQNGKPASFLAGGEYPFPMVQGAGVGGSGAVTIAFKEYGIRLSVIPTITPRGTIRLQVSPEVSALDFGNAVTIAGFTEPAITVRRVKTQVELADRQSFAIGGLLNNIENETFEKIPFLADIPILGKLFQTINKSKDNTELIVIVTPEVVSPVPAGTEIAAPKYTSPFLPPNSNTPMHTPDTNTSEGTLPAPPAAIPVEQLIESMKPEQQLQDGGYSGGGGGGGGAGASTGASPQ